MQPLDKPLYDAVKRDADLKFLAPTSVYKSAWIVREYKKRGGKYSTDVPASSTGLQRWFREKWVDVNRKNEPCGRASSDPKQKTAYPLCRPTIRVTKETPVTLSELSKTQIRSAQQQKANVKEKGRVRFNST